MGGQGVELQQGKPGGGSAAREARGWICLIGQNTVTFAAMTATPIWVCNSIVFKTERMPSTKCSPQEVWHLNCPNHTDAKHSGLL